MEAEKEKAEQEKREEENRKNKIYNEAVSKYESNSSEDVEKAEKLFSSILNWRDSEQYFNKCKDRINELKQQEIIRDENCKRKNKKIIFSTVTMCSCIVLCIGLIVGGYLFYNKVVVAQNVYELAMQSIQNEDYEDAIEKLKTITDYKDASQQIEIATERIMDEKYFMAEKLFDEQRYSEAIEILNQIKEREGAVILKVKCEDALKYEEGVALVEAKKYKEAITLLLYNDFDKNSEKLKECYMELAYQEISKNAYGSALKYFELADYKGEEYKKIYYEKGIEAYENVQYESAITYFKESFDYKDSAEMLKKVTNAQEQRNYFDDDIRKFLDGCWYKPYDDAEGGRVIVIDRTCRSWTGWDPNFTQEYIENDQESLQKVNTSDRIINNGDGTYSVLSKDGNGNDIRLYTLEIAGNSLNVISVFYQTWEHAIGIYNKIV